MRKHEVFAPRMTLRKLLGHQRSQIPNAENESKAYGVPRVYSLHDSTHKGHLMNSHIIWYCSVRAYGFCASIIFLDRGTLLRKISGRHCIIHLLIFSDTVVLSPWVWKKSDSHSRSLETWQQQSSGSVGKVRRPLRVSSCHAWDTDASSSRSSGSDSSRTRGPRRSAGYCSRDIGNAFCFSSSDGSIARGPGQSSTKSNRSRACKSNGFNHWSRGGDEKTNPWNQYPDHRSSQRDQVAKSGEWKTIEKQQKTIEMQGGMLTHLWATIVVLNRL